MKQVGPTLTLILVSVFLFCLLVRPDGSFSIEQPSTLSNSRQLLANPDFNQGSNEWYATAWSSSGNYPTHKQFTFDSSSVTLSQSGNDLSFYAVSLCQGGGPSAFNWGTRSLYVPVNASCHTVVSWRGRMDAEDVSPVGCLGMGVDFWFDAKLSNGTMAPVEMYVFMYQKGVYALPTQSYHDFGVRQDSGFQWLYMYFHPWQDAVGGFMEHRFELNDYVELMKAKAEAPYSSAEFILTKVDACMELFMGSGTFTIDYLGLEQA